MNIPELDNIDWFITRECNQAKFCQFCNAPWNKFPSDADYETALKIAHRIGQLQIETVTLCGGEPTQYPYLSQIIEKLSGQNIKVVLYSNTVSVPDFDWSNVLSKISVLSLPLDALSSGGMQFMRGAHQTAGVKRILEQVTEMENPPIIKVGTVVTAGNVDELPAIYQLLLEQLVQVWRLYQFSPYGLGLENQSKYTISDDQFYAIVEQVEKTTQDMQTPLAISARSRKDIAEGYCRIMDSRGNFYRYDELQYNPLGITIFDSPEQILASYDNELNLSQKAWHKLTPSLQTHFEAHSLVIAGKVTQ